MKYKVGDKVRIKSMASMHQESPPDQYGRIIFNNLSFNENMRTYCGQQGTIVQIDDNLYRVKFDYKKRKSGYYYCDEMLDLVEAKNYHKLKKLKNRMIKSSKFNEELL